MIKATKVLVVGAIHALFLETFMNYCQIMLTSSLPAPFNYLLLGLWRWIITDRKLIEVKLWGIALQVPTISRSAAIKGPERETRYLLRSGKVKAKWRIRPERMLGCFPLCHKFRKFRSEVKWNGPFGFGPTGIFGTTSGGGPLKLALIDRTEIWRSILTKRYPTSLQ